MVDLCAGVGHGRSKLEVVLERPGQPRYGAAQQPEREAPTSILKGSEYNVRYAVQKLLPALTGMIQVTATALALAVAPVAGQEAESSLAARTKGAPTAPVTVYEMSDFQCPFCKRFAQETFPEIERRYITPGKVRWVYINYPLTNLHPHAVPAAELALCAARQNGFWRIHDLLFQYQETWAPLKEAGPFFVSLADSAKLSKKAMLACLQDPETRKSLQTEAEGAERAGAGSTPAFYIEGGLLEGALPLPVFQRILDSVYAAKTGGKKGGR
jgi:protein-disulfide isomerase